MGGDGDAIIKKYTWGKRVKLEAKDRYNLQWNRLICTRGTEPGARDNNTLGIRGNLRGTILGPGKKDCCELQRYHIGTSVKELPLSQKLPRNRMKGSQGRLGDLGSRD